MINFLSSWAKSVGLAIVIISILEMILPNNKTKKYIKIVMGTYILFCIISPFIENSIDVKDLQIENHIQTSTTSEIDQTSMDERIKQLYIQELEKDIKNKIEQQGYKVSKCKVNAEITDNVESTKINKIILQVKKDESKKQKNDNTKVEEKVISEIQKIQDVKLVINNKDESNESNNLTKNEIQSLKKFLKEEYEVNEKCLVIS